MTNKTTDSQVTVIGAGLAGSEAVYQLIHRQIPVKLVEMRPQKTTGAHTTDLFGELVCSNSIGSNLPDRAPGLLKEEMRFLGSYVLDTAYKYRVPAGNALAVDRFAFSREMTRYLRNHNLVEFVNEEAVKIPETGYVIIATGPLTSPSLLSEIQKLLGETHMYFYDAVAPIVSADSINMDIAFREDRYGTPGIGDYINCPMNKEEYARFFNELIKAQCIELSEMEKSERKKYFNACQPVEAIAKGGPDSLRFGPLKPVGLTNPHNGAHPYANVQLRQDNLLATMFNMVGFQTNLKYPEQQRVFRMIPGLENAKFDRLGQMHRNSYINAPKLLSPTLQLRDNPRIFIAGQLGGVEGYTESTATGLLAGLNVARLLTGKEAVSLPPETMLGGLLNYVTFSGHKDFHPMNSNFGLFAGREGEKTENRRERIIKTARRALREFTEKL